MKKINKTLILAMSTTLMTGLTSVAMAGEVTERQDNVFKMTELSSGYMQMAAADSNTAEKPAAAKSKAAEAKCAGNKPISTAPKAAEAACGEGKCGGTMKHEAAGAAKPAKVTPNAKSAIQPANSAPAKPATDASGKSADGKCGQGKCGGAMKKAAEESSATKK